MTTPDKIAEAIKKKLPVISQKPDGLHISQGERKMLLRQVSSQKQSNNIVR